MSRACEISVAAKTLDHFGHKAYMLVGLAIDNHLHIQANTFALIVNSKEGHLGRRVPALGVQHWEAKLINSL